MARERSENHENAPPAGGTALLLIDVINGFDFPGAKPLVAAAERAAEPIAKLSERARRAEVPVIYVNDNFGRWRSDFQATVEACMAPDQPGRRVATRLRPHAGDYFVLKPLHSAFFATPLELLLRHLRIETLVLAGFATNICLLFTANDAHMLGFRLRAPRDCTAANSPALKKTALDHMKQVLHADVRAARSVRFSKSARTKRA